MAAIDRKDVKSLKKINLIRIVDFLIIGFLNSEDFETRQFDLSPKLVLIYSILCMNKV